MGTKTPKKMQEEIEYLQQELINEKRISAGRKIDLDGSLKALQALVTLTENWAYGPAFKRCGVIWPNNTCNAPAYLGARRFLKLYFEANDG